ncbi:hemicentin-2-like [Dreissena polymorpha]|uniref:Uncharacterized protein n=1 Tax=Dreissena polymorpha TaxID=45954 RepID=A0A9D4DEB6_DREPO|nr:hemicentin-2-like [Dreissena polymorpha]KAH3746930.1 hypothetical protein DPMN_181348 [Dreissena polymorpha]
MDVPTGSIAKKQSVEMAVDEYPGTNMTAGERRGTTKVPSRENCLKGVVCFLSMLAAVLAFAALNYFQFREITNLRQRIEFLENGYYKIIEKVIFEPQPNIIQERQARGGPVMIGDITLQQFIRDTVEHEVLNSNCEHCQTVSRIRAVPFDQQCCSALSKPGIYGRNSSVEAIGAYFGQTITLPCNGSGYPPPTIQWVFHSPNQSARYVPTSDGLQILNVQQVDSGRFTCIMENVLGKYEKHIDLLVTDPVVATTTPINVDAKVGEAFQIVCDVSGKPPPIVTWEQIRADGTRFPVNNGMQLSIGRNTLTFSAAKPSDAGTYICTAQNQYETDQAQTTVTIRGSPEIVNPPLSQTVFEGETVTLRCDVISNPPSMVTWTYPLTGSRPPLNARQNPDNSITLAIVDRSNAGSYTCTATNVDGTVTAQSSLNVIERLMVTASPHLIPMYGNETFLNLQCSSSGTPKPTVTWSRSEHGTITGNGKYIVLPGGNLIVTGASLNTDTGIYICYGENNNGNSSDKVIAYKDLGPLTCLTVFSDMSAMCAVGQFCGGTCPTNCDFSAQTIFGNRTYSEDSPICMSGTHKGSLPNSSGLVIWRPRGIVGSLYGSTANGITSQDRLSNGTAVVAVLPSGYSTANQGSSAPLFG